MAKEGMYNANNQKLAPMSMRNIDVILLPQVSICFITVTLTATVTVTVRETIARFQKSLAIRNVFN